MNPTNKQSTKSNNNKTNKKNKEKGKLVWVWVHDHLWGSLGCLLAALCLGFLMSEMGMFIPSVVNRTVQEGCTSLPTCASSAVKLTLLHGADTQRCGSEWTSQWFYTQPLSWPSWHQMEQGWLAISHPKAHHKWVSKISAAVTHNCNTSALGG